MDKKTEALKLAQDWYDSGNENHDDFANMIKQVIALVEQPAQQEPVAWMHWLHGPVRLFLNKDKAQMELERLNREYPVDADGRKMRPLVFGDTSSQRKPWVGLTDEEIENIWEGSTVPILRKEYINLARAIEAKLKEKNA